VLDLVPRCLLSVLSKVPIKVLDFAICMRDNMQATIIFL
jgi:hypothetical protein